MFDSLRRRPISVSGVERSSGPSATPQGSALISVASNRIRRGGQTIQPCSRCRWTKMTNSASTRLWCLRGASLVIVVTSTAVRLFLRRPAISSRAFRPCSRQSPSMGARTAYALTLAASGSPSVGTAVQCGLAIGSLLAEPQPPTAQEKSSVQAIPKGRRSISCLRLQRASPLWAERSRT